MSNNQLQSSVEEIVRFNLRLDWFILHPIEQYIPPQIAIEREVEILYLYFCRNSS